MSALIRVASLRGFTPLVLELGGNPDEYLGRFGIPPRLLESEDGMVSITDHDRMLDAVATELDCADFGLRLAQAQGLSVLGPLALAIEASGTVSQALECASRFMFVHSPALSISVEPDPRAQRGVVALTYRKDLARSPYSPQAMELGLSLFHRIALALMQTQLGLISIEFPHEAISSSQRYAEAFGCPVNFGSVAGSMRIDRHLLDQRFAFADEIIREVALDYLRKLHPEPEPSTTEQVRQVLAGRLGTAPCTVEAVARLLATSPRTLQRRLDREQTSFARELDEARGRAAYRFITTTDLPFTQIASMVGFAEQASLTRAVQRRHGTSPRMLRRRAHGPRPDAERLAR